MCDGKDDEWKSIEIFSEFSLGWFSKKLNQHLKLKKIQKAWDMSVHGTTVDSYDSFADGKSPYG